MRKILLIAMFFMGSALKADIQWPQVNVSDATISYGSGFLMASLYDLAFDATANYKDYSNWDNSFAGQMGPQPQYDLQSDRDGYWKVPSPFGRYWRYWAWKMGLSMAAGAVWELHVADRDNKPVGLGNIGMGALGGLSSVVIHF